MKTIAKSLQEKFNSSAIKAYPELAQEIALNLEVVQSTQEKFGHYQCNSAMKLAKILGKKPREISEALIANLDKLDAHQAMISHLEIAGPGFINITLSPAFISSYLDALFQDSHLGVEQFPNQRIVIDFSSPNTAKEMHVGHLRSTIIGDCLANLFEFFGCQVLRLNHIGDWGTSFGMLIAYMKIHAPHVLEGNEPTNLTHLVNWYKASKQLFDNDVEFKKTAQLEVVALQGGEKNTLKAWNLICEISRQAYQEIYDLLKINVTERGESFYNSLLANIVADLESKGLVTISDGAKCIFLEGFQNREGESLPLMIQKSDGGYNYDTTDMAAMHHRIQTEKASRIIIVTDAGQAQHFKMIENASQLAGYLDASKVRFDHVPFGLVLGNDGKKFRTRSGETERLIDLITTAIDKATSILMERSPEMPIEEREELAKALGISAIKYADLSCNRTGDYTFSYDRMLRFEGNTAAFLMYAYVRIAGIKRKVNADMAQLIKITTMKVVHPSEISLGVHVAQFSETLEQVANDLLPNRLCDYLYILAEKFNAFFRDCRVEGTDEQNERLLLCETVGRVMHRGLEILGLNTVEKM